MGREVRRWSAGSWTARLVRWDVATADSNGSGDPSPTNLAELEQAADTLTDIFRASLVKLNPDELLLWSRFLHGDGIAAFVAAQSDELELIADEVMSAYTRWGQSEKKEPERASTGLEEEFRMRVWRKLSGRTDLTPRLRKFVHHLVKDAVGLRGKEGAFVNLRIDGDDAGCPTDGPPQG